MPESAFDEVSDLYFCDCTMHTSSADSDSHDMLCRDSFIQHYLLLRNEEFFQKKNHKISPKQKQTNTIAIYIYIYIVLSAMRSLEYCI